MFCGSQCNTPSSDQKNVTLVQTIKICRLVQTIDPVTKPMTASFTNKSIHIQISTNPTFDTSNHPFPSLPLLPLPILLLLLPHLLPLPLYAPRTGDNLLPFLGSDHPLQ
uniref:Uncharacterized protein n=1 Tax=Cacopsylla melanoneura TaxID=428564 RepID=A0A8D8LM59_9HEMI